MIEVTFGDLDEARAAVDKLLAKKLAASCQMVESESKWNWRGETESSKEYLVLMKTRKALAQKVYEVIRQIHSYECFEFAVFDLESCGREYLGWIEEETRGIW